jgi:type VI secretion system protein ImpJ
MTTRSTKSLYWHQGMFLQSHHFQYQEQFLQSELARQQAFAQIDPVGIYRLQINEDAVKAGIVEIDSMLLIMPDGTQLSFPGNCQVPRASVDTSQMENTDKLSVYLQIHALDPNNSNLSTEAEKRRYTLQQQSIEFRDLYNNEETASLATLALDCSLHIGDSAQLNNDSFWLEIAQIVQDGDNLKLSDSFIPKVANIEASHVLKSLIKTIKQQLLARYDQLESYNIFVSTDNKDITPSAFSNMCALQVIARYAPAFHSYEVKQYMSPEQLYLTCSQLIGELSIFSKRANVLGESNDKALSLNAFNRNQLTECFARVQVMIKTLLDELTIDPELILSLSHSGEMKYVTPVSADFTRESNELYIRLRSERNLEDLANSICENAKFGADGQADIYLKRALPGVSLKYLPRKPVGVAGTPNSYFFTFSRTESQWHKVLESGRVAFIWPDAPDDLAIELIAVRG